MTSLYRQIFKQSIKISWRHKFLWLFGFFAAWVSISGEYEIIFGSRLKIFQQGLSLIHINNFITQTGILKINTISNLKHLLLTEPLTIIPMILLFFLILGAVIFVVWAIIVSQGGIISSIKKVDQNKNTDFSEGLQMGMNKFWPLFWLNILAKLIVFILFTVMGLLLAIVLTKDFFAGQALTINWYNLVLFFVAFVIFIPLAIIISFVTRYASCYVVIKNYRFRDSLKLGFTLFIKNWLISLEMALLLILIYFVASLLLSLVLLIIAVPLAFLVVTFYSLNSSFGFWITVGFGLTLVLIISVLFSAWLATFQFTNWTLLFIQLTEKGGISKLVRLATELPSHLRKASRLVK